MSGELGAARPTDDAIEMDDVRARVARALFGAAEPARLGRFVLRGPLAGGGMGMVYSAYDPKLDRRVALKRIHPHRRDDAHARARLLAEARALARLDHPNVVPVHDVVEVDDQIILVMELVDGQTVAAWAQARPRTWREALAVYIEAGRGLRAAHQLGVTHRDFKPANAIVGEDGRVRVLDFGLARFASGAPEGAEGPLGTEGPAGAEGAKPAEGAETTAPPPLTAAGEVLGTLGFMAPEQLRGELATPASDQFSFCAALHRTLCGALPFAGATAPALLSSIEAGRIEPGPTGAGVPGWLRAVIARGLAADPAARFPSMDDLLAQLERPRGWRRWGAPALAAVAVGATALAAIAITRPAADPLAACDGGAAEVGAIWGPWQRALVGARLAAIDAPIARPVRERALEKLDSYRDAWSSQHRDACALHRRGAQSDRTHDRQAACLRQRLGDLSSAVGVIQQLDRDSIGNAADVVASLRPVAACGDPVFLESGREPPAGLVVGAQVAGLDQQLSEVRALEKAGRLAEAVSGAAAAVAVARLIGYPPALVDALLAQGRIQIARHDHAAAGAPLAEAQRLALELGLYADAVVAGARWIFVEGAARERLLGEAAILEPLSRGLSGDPFARPLLLNNLGVLDMRREDRDGARQKFEEAHRALAGIQEPDLELAFIDKNLAMLTPDTATRVALARGAWERLRDALGEEHPRTLEALVGYARYHRDAPEALRLVTEACRRYRELHPTLISDLVICLAFQAALATDLGDARQATALYDDIVQRAAGLTQPDVVFLRDLAAGYAALHRGDARGARDRFESVRGRFDREAGWWNRKRVGYALLGRGQAEQALGDHRAALADLDQAAAIFSKMTSINENFDHHLGLRAALRAAEALRASRPASQSESQSEPQSEKH